MYVADMTLEDAIAHLGEVKAEVARLEAQGYYVHEQLVWDIEDLEGRILGLVIDSAYEKSRDAMIARAINS
jgi:hypothetical protein